MDAGEDVPEAVRLVERVLVEAFAGGRTKVIAELSSPDLVEHQFGMQAVGAEAVARARLAARQVHEMAPDVTYTIEDWAQHDDVTWVRAIGRGTQTGPLLGPPSGRPFEITVIDVVRVRDGLIAEHWGVPDRFALLSQTGALERLTTG